VLKDTLAQYCSTGTYVWQYSGLLPKLLPVPFVSDQQPAHENVAVDEQQPAVSDDLGLDEQHVAICESSS
jgi:hypothetical protein